MHQNERNKLTVNGTKSAEALYSDLGGGHSSLGVIQILGGHSDLDGSLRFGGHSDLGVIQVYGVIQICRWLHLATLTTYTYTLQVLLWRWNVCLRWASKQYSLKQSFRSNEHKISLRIENLMYQSGTVNLKGVVICVTFNLILLWMQEKLSVCVVVIFWRK